nr:hypothetical protein [uncultured bacterium]
MLGSLWFRKSVEPQSKLYVSSPQPRLGRHTLLHHFTCTSPSLGGTLCTASRIQPLRLDHHEAHCHGSLEVSLRWTPIRPDLEFHASFVLPNDPHPGGLAACS